MHVKFLVRLFGRKLFVYTVDRSKLIGSVFAIEGDFILAHLTAVQLTDLIKGELVPAFLTQEHTEKLFPTCAMRL